MMTVLEKQFLEMVPMVLKEIVYVLRDINEELKKINNDKRDSSGPGNGYQRTARDEHNE